MQVAWIDGVLDGRVRKEGTGVVHVSVSSSLNK